MQLRLPGATLVGLLTPQDAGPARLHSLHSSTPLCTANCPSCLLHLQLGRALKAGGREGMLYFVFNSQARSGSRVHLRLAAELHARHPSSSKFCSAPIECLPLPALTHPALHADTNSFTRHCMPTALVPVHRRPLPWWSRTTSQRGSLWRRCACCFFAWLGLVTAGGCWP